MSLAGSTTKKVVVRRFDREPLTGFVSVASYQRREGIELLKQDGDVSVVAYGEIKSVCFVKDFESAREPLEARLFQTRPKMAGLWVRLEFRDGDMLDGVIPNNLLQLEAEGYTITPPEPYSNHQRIFVPKEALKQIQVVGVVGSPLRAKTKAAAKPSAPAQQDLFE